jgi:hypothetical protein
MSTGTITNTITNAYTEARARYVKGKIFDDFNSMIYRGFTSISSKDLKDWRDDIQYIIERDALNFFEIQFRSSDKKWAVRYEVDKLGNISRDDDSGGVDFYNIPEASIVSIVVKRDKTNNDVSDYLEKRGWGTGGEFIAESASSDKSYSKDGFGVNRKILGDL